MYNIKIAIRNTIVIQKICLFTFYSALKKCIFLLYPLIPFTYFPILPLKWTNFCHSLWLHLVSKAFFTFFFSSFFPFFSFLFFLFFPFFFLLFSVVYFLGMHLKEIYKNVIIWIFTIYYFIIITEWVNAPHIVLPGPPFRYQAKHQE